MVHTGESIYRGFGTGANDSAPIGDYALQQGARRRPIDSMLCAMFTLNLCTLECWMHFAMFTTNFVQWSTACKVHWNKFSLQCIWHCILFYDVTLGTVLCTLGLLLYGVPMCCAVCSAKLRALCCAQNYCNDSASNGQLQQQWHACMMSFWLHLVGMLLRRHENRNHRSNKIGILRKFSHHWN